MKYNEDMYYYIKNLQEDIIGIKDANFNLVATYEYDSWGKILSIKDSNGKRIGDKINAINASMPSYVATPLGTLRKFDSFDGSDIVLFMDIPFDLNHPLRK